MKNWCLITLSALLLSGCIPDSGKMTISAKKKPTTTTGSGSIANASISSVKIVNNQLVISGKNLSNVKEVKLNGTSFSEMFAVESKSATHIIANSLKHLSIDVSKVFSLILSDANASATFQIDFSLCNATLYGKGFDCVGVTNINDNDVLTFDAGENKWIPKPLNSLSYQGTLDASGTMPSAGAAGEYYIVIVAGHGFNVGDWAVSNGTSFDQINNSTSVTKVFNRIGNVVATEGDYSLNLLSDVTLPTLTGSDAGKILKYNGSQWVLGDDLNGGGAGSVMTSSIANSAVTDAKIDTVSASKITGTINSTQILDGTIANADISASAAIDYSKLNIPNTSIPYAKLNIANGDIPAAKISGLPSATAVLATSITDSDTTHAPDGNAVFDALSGKLGLTGGTLTTGTINGVPTPVNPSDVVNKDYVDDQDDLLLLKTGGTLSGLLSLDADLRMKGATNYVTLKAHATTAAYDLVLPETKGTSGQVLSTDGNGNTSWTTPAAAPMMLTGVGGSGVNPSTTSYASFGGSGFSTEGVKGIPLAQGGTLSKFYMKFSSAQPASGTLVVTVRVNGVDTGITFTVLASAAAATYSDTTHSAVVSAGDVVTIGFINGATGAPSANVAGYSIMLQ